MAEPDPIDELLIQVRAGIVKDVRIVEDAEQRLHIWRDLLAKLMNLKAGFGPKPGGDT